MATEAGDAIPLHRHPKPHRELARRYRTQWKDKDYRIAVAASFFVFAGSVAASLLAGHFANTQASNPVDDLILSNVSVVNVDVLFVYGTFLFCVFVAVLAFAHPRRIPFTFFSLAIFFFIRAGFVMLTHIAPFPVQASPNFGGTIREYFFGSDLFFSGHTGSPFLMALIFWHEYRLRVAFLAWSVFFAGVVLLGHLHYSIDVASAYFITYSIFVLCEKWLPEYRALFYSDWPEEQIPEDQETATVV